MTIVRNFANTAAYISANGQYPAANVTGLGTMATQNANAIAVTGGTISGTGITSSNVTITGGTINSVAHTGGTLNNMTIGATTANTGAFTTLTANLATFAGNASSVAFNTVNIVEPTTNNATGAASTINFDVTTQSIYYSTANATANWTVNFRGSSTLTLANTLANNQTITVTLMATQGATAYYNSLVQIDGSTVTPKWQSGTAPTSGNTGSVDVYNYVITKISTAPTYTVLASQTKFA